MAPVHDARQGGHRLPLRHAQPVAARVPVEWGDRAEPRPVATYQPVRRVPDRRLAHVRVGRRWSADDPQGRGWIDLPFYLCAAPVVLFRTVPGRHAQPGTACEAAG